MMPPAHQPNASKLHQYRHLFLKYKFRFGLGILALFVTNAAGAAIPHLIQEAIDLLHGAPTGSGALALHTQLSHLLWTMLALAILVFVARVLSRIWITGAGQRVEYDLRDLLYRHLQKMPSQFYASHPTGELMSRMTNDVEALRMMVGGGIMMTFNTLFVYCTTLPMIYRISPTLTLIAFALYPLAVFGLSKLSTRVKKLYYAVQDVLGQFSTLVQENFTGIAVIQAYGKESVENRRIAGESQRYFTMYQALIKERVLMMMVFVILGGISYLAVLSFGGWQVIRHQVTLGGFIAFTLYLERITWPTAAMGWIFSTIQQGTAALERVDDVLSQQPNIISPERPVHLPQPVRGAIEIHQLSFAYDNPYQQALEAKTGETPPRQAMPLVLKHLNLSITAGDTVAIVGPIGSGKSTLLRLLPRLYNVPDNTVFLDGVDINMLSLQELRASMVLMSQQSFLFSTSVAQNLAFANPALSNAEALADPRNPVILMTEAAQVHREILALPRQYDTLVGERGVMLSGGQRQRVSLARTLLQSQLIQAPILILDDPFSQVDAGTEEAIIHALEERKLLHHRTTLFATHRMSMVKKADQVILMNQGEIVATGIHSQLLDTQPLYRQLHQEETEHQQESEQEGAKKDELELSELLNAPSATEAGHTL